METGPGQVTLIHADLALYRVDPGYCTLHHMNLGTRDDVHLWLRVSPVELGRVVHLVHLFLGMLSHVAL